MEIDFPENPTEEERGYLEDIVQKVTGEVIAENCMDHDRITIEYYDDEDDEGEGWKK